MEDSATFGKDYNLGDKASTSLQQESLTVQSVEMIISSMSLTSIQSEIRKLDPAARASLIDLIWDSLDGEHIKEIEAKWAAESEHRIDAFERGELPGFDGPSALEELRSSLQK